MGRDSPLTQARCRATQRGKLAISSPSLAWSALVLGACGLAAAVVIALRRPGGSTGKDLDVSPKPSQARSSGRAGDSMLGYRVELRQFLETRRT